MSNCLVIGILNITPDSFASNPFEEKNTDLIDDALRMVGEGAYGLDLGAVATHPRAAFVSEQEEWKRLSCVIPDLRRELPNIPLSVDTYRASIAERVIGEWGVNVINDISGGQWDARMYDVVCAAKVAYIIGHTQGSVENPTSGGTYTDFMADLIDYFVYKIDALRQAGASKVVIDPGFGFSKSIDQNLYLLSHLHYLQCLDAPIMVGVSRKRMIYEPLQVLPTSDEALQGSLRATEIAIKKGAAYLRVHDVKQTVDLIKTLC